MRYLATAAAVFLLLALGVAATTLAIDPFAVFARSMDTRPVQHFGLLNYPRLALPMGAIVHRPRTVIIGSSRARDGYDPDLLAQALPGPVMDFGASGMNVWEQEAYIGLLADIGSVRNILISTSLSDYNSHMPRFWPGFDPSLLKPSIPWHHWLTVTLSRAALESAYRSVAGGPNPESSSGFQIYPDYACCVEKPVVASAVDYQNSPTAYGRLDNLDEGLRAFETMLDRLKGSGITVTVLIPPEHALNLEGFHERGIVDVYENWKTRIAALAAAHGISVWDFSGFNSITMVPIMEASAYYLDGAHFNARTGCLMFKRVFAVVDCKGKVPPDDFGHLLLPGTIDAYLQQDRKRRPAYVETRHEDIAAFKAEAERQGLKLP